MLSMKEILELSNDMSVEIIDNIDNKHYIINECGQSVEFDLDMLMKKYKTCTIMKMRNLLKRILMM